MRFGTESKRARSFAGRPMLSLSSFMLAIAVGIISSLTFSAAYDMARAALAGERHSVSGVWHGAWNGVHAVTIRLEQNGDRLSGTARFSIAVATGDGPKAAGETPELALVNPQLDGETLSFTVHGLGGSCKSTVAVVEMNFNNEGEAELRRKYDPPEDEMENEETVILMMRERSF